MNYNEFLEIAQFDGATDEEIEQSSADMIKYNEITAGLRKSIIQIGNYKEAVQVQFVTAEEVF